VDVFNDRLNDIFQEFALEPSLRTRWIVTPSKVSVTDGYQEQMLDKMHADLYTDAAYVSFLDTDSVLPRDFTPDQQMDAEGRPYLCYRTVEKCGEPCRMWMMDHVRHMVGDGEMLDQEYMCSLGASYPRKMFPRLRSLTEAHQGKEWQDWVADALGSGAETTWEKGLTEFNAFGAVLWQDYHDEVHWIDQNSVGFDLMVRPLAVWSHVEDASRLAARKMLECLIDHQHDGGDYNHNGRVIWCKNHLNDIVLPTD